mgnify:CR=1 FL=1
MADLQARVAAQALTFVAIPSAENSAGFVRFNERVFSVYVGGRASAESPESCVEADGERALFVGGFGCRSLLESLLD